MIIHEELNSIKRHIEFLEDRLNMIGAEMHDRSMDPSTTGDEMMKLIRNEMKNQGIKQRTLSDITGFTPPSVSLYLSGKRKAPVEFLVPALEVVGYKVQVVPVLPFTPEKGEE